MHPLAAFGLVLALVALAAGMGMLWHRRQGVVTTVAVPATDGPSTDAPSTDAPSTAWVICPTDVAASAPFGARATLLQFSTEFCAKCPGTRRLLGAVAEARAGVVHLDVDLTHRADLANRFNIFQTPTTIVLDGTGRIRARVGGVPNRAQLARHLDELLIPSSTGE